MHIIHIIDEYFPPEKGYTAPYNYCLNLVKLGFKVTVFCGRRDGETIEEYVKGVHVYRTKKIYKWNNRLDRMKLICLLLKHLKDLYNADIWHVYYSFISPFIHTLAKLLRKDSICDIRSIPLKRSFVGQLLRIFSAKLATKVTIIDYSLTKNLHSKYIKQKANLLPLGVDLKQYVLKIKTNHDSIIKIVNVSSMDRIRRQEDIIYAVASLKNKTDKYNLPKFQITMIGGGENMSKIIKLVEKLGVKNYIDFKGIVSPDQIPILLSDKDVGISYLPIKTFDCQPPTKTIEYFAAGLFVIATKTEGNINICKNFDKNQYLLIEDNISSLKEAIIKILRNPPVRKVPSIKNLQKFDWSHIVKKYLLPLYFTK